jgi:predicted nicotinamide N-methyase
MARPGDPDIVKPEALAPPPDAAAFVRRRLRLTDVPDLPGIRLYVGQPDSGLGRFVAEHNGGRPPYWAYPWSGGMALARYLREHPQAVCGRRVLDLGAGGGLVAIAAAQNGAGQVHAAEIDPLGATALVLNAEANEVAIEVLIDDLLPGPPPPVDLIVAGDLFYAPDVARRTTSFLARCRAAGIEVLVGDPGRRDLPLDRLTRIATYDVPEVGEPRGAATTPAAVYAFDRLIPP